MFRFDIRGGRFAFIQPNSVPAYLLASVIIAVGTGLRISLSPWLEGVQFITFLPAVGIAALVCGAGPGWLSVVLSTLSAWYFILPPQLSFAIERPGDIAALGFFVVVAAAEVLIVGALRQSLARSRTLDRTLSAVFDANPDAMLLLDRSHRIVRVNERARALFGYEDYSLIGLNIECLLPERLRAAHLATRDLCSATEEVREMAPAGQPLARHQDGREFPVSVLLGPIEFESDLLVVAIVRDLTAQKAAAAALADSQRQRAMLEERERSAGLLRRWSDAFENAAFGIAITDPRTNTIVLANPALAAMRGTTCAELEGGRVADAYDTANEFLRVRPLIAQADRTGHVAFESWHRHRSGTSFPVEISVTSVRNADGDPIYRIVSVLDITERRRTEEALRQAQKMEAVGTVAGGMAHDFNNLLGVIIGNLELCTAVVEAEPTAKELVADALQAALAGADLTRRLLAFARRQPLQSVPAQPNELVARIAKLLNRVLGENIEVSLDPGDDVWPVLVDPAQLETSLINLATNARDAMPQGGKLAIVTANYQIGAEDAALNPGIEPGDYALIEMSDTGVGMAPDALKRVFEPFYTTKKPGKGTGLGLSMVFGFAKQSGGHVTIYSAPGLGTTVRLYLPRAIAATETEAPAVRPAVATGTGEVVLVVEDNAALRQVAVRQLAGLGYTVIEADGPQAALAILAETHVDLLFSDIVMPGAIDGVELARQTLDRWPDTAILLTSGFSEHRLEEHLEPRSGLMRLLKKPYRRADLAKAVRDALHGLRHETDDRP